MYLIVNLGISDETEGIDMIVPVIEQRKRSGAEKGVRSEILTPSFSIVPETVGGAVVNGAVLISPIGILSRVEESRRADNSSVCTFLVRVHTLGVEVDGEVLVEEVRRKAEVEGSPVIF